MDSYKDLVRRLRDHENEGIGIISSNRLRDEAASAIEAMERMITDISMRKPRFVPGDDES
jgi:hypothetical protein